MTDEKMYDVVPDTDDKPRDTGAQAKAWIVEVPLERAMEALETANERYEEHGLTFSVKESTGDRETTSYREEQLKDNAE